MKKKFIKNSFIALGFSIVSFSVCPSEPAFQIENATGQSPYTLINPLKSGEIRELKDIRIRVTFHETAKDVKWLNNHKDNINKASLPIKQGEVSELTKVKYPAEELGKLSASEVEFITLYITASSSIKNKPGSTPLFKGGFVTKLDKPQIVNHILIRFEGFDTKKVLGKNGDDKIINMPKIKLKINEDSVKTKDLFRDYDTNALYEYESDSEEILEQLIDLTLEN